MNGRIFVQGLVVAAALFLTGCKQDAYQGLAERDANEMMAVLMEQGIDAERSKKERDGFAVRVESADFSRAIKALLAAGLPRESFKTLDDVFPGGKLVMSPAEHRARFAFGVGQELSRSVGQIAGVSWDRVHVALAVYDLRGKVISPSTAAIVIRYREGADIGEISAQAREIVAHAVEGLLVENVRVVLSGELAQQHPAIDPCRKTADVSCTQTQLGSLQP